MREILFRGKSVDHLGWEHGDLITSFGKTYIGNTVGNDRDNWCEVDPETVGQFTGLLDKNGKKIFEGDLCHLFIKEPTEIIYENGAFGYLDSTKSFISFSSNRWFKWDKDSKSIEVKIIGNIHD